MPVDILYRYTQLNKVTNMAERKNITQPSDWWREFERAARQAGKTLSEWIGDAAVEQIDPERRGNLTERAQIGRPKAESAQ